MVLPLLLLLLLGVVDVGRFMWTWNQAEKATQMGARYAAVTGFIPSYLGSYSFANGTYQQGAAIPAAAFGGVHCEQGTCTAEGGVPDAADANYPGYDDAAFTRLVDRMSTFYGAIDRANVEINYDWSGLGYAGDPNAPDVSAQITVRLRGLSFTPYSTLGMLDIDLPDFAAAVTTEDGDGTFSN